MNLYKYIRGIILLIMLLSFNNQFLFAQSMSIHLQSNWKFREGGTKEWMPANVPGCVHTDLLSNKKIEDPYFRANEESQQWIGQKDWEYSTSFDVEKPMLANRTISLVFEGLDTYADVYLNGEPLLSADNMHRTWRINCTGKLKEKDNHLLVYFHSVFKKAMPLITTAPFPLFQFPNNDQADTMVSMYVRKAGYHFGWDWGPRLVTAGIWKQVSLEAFDISKIEGVQITTKSLAKNLAAMTGMIEVKSLQNTDGVISIKMEDQTIVNKKVALKAGLNKINVEFEVKNPKLWWSNGLGKANLYSFAIQLSHDEQIADTYLVTTGIRTIKVVTEKDQFGKSLYVVLNGRPVFMKGANYIPSDNFTNRTSDKQYEFTVKSAAEANMNMLRVWGGGYFEKDIFYNLCDQYGILVWQDMLFACATYPANETYYKSVTEEIKDNLKRIRNHPGLALYNGNNEVEVAYYQWGYKQKLNPENQLIQEANMKKLFYEVIPQAIQSVDSTRYYHPTSPNTGYNNIPLENGDVHYWSVWHGKEPFESYNTNVGRFMSEYGFQSYPELETVKSFTLPEDRELNSKVMQSHQRCMADDLKDKGYGNRLIKHYMQQYYKEPVGFDNYLYVSQLLQQKGMAIAIEAHRRNMPKCMGTLYWQINDCWPVASWSSIDYAGKWKAAHYKVRDLYKEFLISTMIEKGKLKVYIVSDKTIPANVKLKITITALSGKQLFSKVIRTTIDPNASKVYFEIDSSLLLKGLNKKDIFFSASIAENANVLATNNFYFVPEKELNLGSTNILTNIDYQAGKYIITLTSKQLAKDVYVSIPGVTGFLSNNYFDLLPGVTSTIYFEPEKPDAGLKNSFKFISLVDSY